MRVAFVLSAFVVLATIAGASAAARMPVSNPMGVVEGIGTSGLQQIYSEIGLPLQVAESNANTNTTTYIATIDEQHKFFVTATACENGSCAVVVLWTVVATGNAGLEFANAFSSKTNIGKAFVLATPERPTIVAHDFVVGGGVTRNAVALQPAVFVALMTFYGEERGKFESGRSASLPPLPGPALAPGAPGFAVSASFTDAMVALARKHAEHGGLFALPKK